MTEQTAYQQPPTTPHATGTNVEVDGVSRVFGDFIALQSVRLSIAPGEFISLVGPSGCGKSTLLKTIAGLLPPTVGQVVIGETAVTGPRPEIGVMFQTSTLFPWRTAWRNITLPLDVAGDKRDVDARVRDAIEMVGLRGFEEHYPRELSGGMQQRVALCRLLVSDPEVMLLDEPFGALDEFTRERLNVELARISERERKTTVFVTHNIAEAVFLADRVVVMGTQPGRVLEVVDVELPRPRTPDQISSPQMAEHVRAIRAVLGLE